MTALHKQKQIPVQLRTFSIPIRWQRYARTDSQRDLSFWLANSANWPALQP